MPRRNLPAHRRRSDPFAKAVRGTYIPAERLAPSRANHWPPIDHEHICPDCKVERADWEGPGVHLVSCPNCDSKADPVPAS